LLKGLSKLRFQNQHLNLKLYRMV